MSLSLCLYVCCKYRPLYQNQMFKIPITLYNARRQHSSRTVELVDHTYDGRRVARHTHTHVRRTQCSNCITSISYGFVVDLVPTMVQQLTRFCLIQRVVQSVCSRRASWLQLVQRKYADARTTRSLVVIKVDRSTSSQYCACAFSAVFQIF